MGEQATAGLDWEEQVWVGAVPVVQAVQAVQAVIAAAVLRAGQRAAVVDL